MVLQIQRERYSIISDLPFEPEELFFLISEDSKCDPTRLSKGAQRIIFICNHTTRILTTVLQLSAVVTMILKMINPATLTQKTIEEPTDDLSKILQSKG